MANSRNKGNKNERKAAALITAWTKKKFERTPSSGGLQWKASFSKGDIVCTDDKMYFPFCVEVKAHKEIDFSHLLIPGIKNIKIMEFWEQCTRDAKTCNKIPLLMMRYDRLPADFFFVGMPKEYLQFCIAPFLSQSKIKSSIIYGDIAIIPSDWFFSIPYSRIKNIAKNFARNLEEIIKPFPLFPEKYDISNRGYLIVKSTGYKIWGSQNPSGVRVTKVNTEKLYGGKSKTISIYRWVAKSFVKNPKLLPYVNHVLPDRSISDARNLEWVTAQGNSQHYWDNKKLEYKIVKVELGTQKELAEYRTASEAAKSLGKKGGSTITKVIQGHRESAYGFFWKKVYITKQ